MSTAFMCSPVFAVDIKTKQFEDRVAPLKAAVLDFGLVQNLEELSGVERQRLKVAAHLVYDSAVEVLTKHCAEIVLLVCFTSILNLQGLHFPPFYFLTFTLHV